MLTGGRAEEGWGTEKGWGGPSGPTVRTLGCSRMVLTDARYLESSAKRRGMRPTRRRDARGSQALGKAGPRSPPTAAGPRSPRPQPRRALGQGWTQQVRCGLEARSPGSEGYRPARKLPSSRGPGRAPKKYRVSPCSLVVAVGTRARGARRARAQPARPGRAAGFTRPGHSAFATGAPEVDAAKVVSVCIFLITSVIEHLFRRLAGLPRLVAASAAQEGSPALPGAPSSAWRPVLCPL